MKIKLLKTLKYHHCTLFKRGDIVDVISIKSPNIYAVATPEHARSVWPRDTIAIYMSDDVGDYSGEARVLSPLELLAMEA